MLWRSNPPLSRKATLRNRGHVVAALVDETTVTLKRLVKEKGRVILRAMNSKYKDIVPQRLESQGVVVGLIRRLVA